MLLFPFSLCGVLDRVSVSGDTVLGNMKSVEMDDAGEVGVGLEI